MATWIQHIVNGLMQGTVYGLVAMGFTIFFGVMNVIKFSHGDVFTFGAFGGLVAVWLADAVGLPIWSQLLFGFAIAILVASALGACISRVLILPLRHAPAVNMLLMTMMVGTAIREIIRLFFPNGSNPQRFPSLLPEGGLEFLGAYVRLDGMLLILGGVGSIALVHLIINRTRFGLAMRAVAEDTETASMMGINFERIAPLTFALGSMTAGFAGVMYGVYYSEVSYNMGLLLSVIGFSAAIVGGLGNIWGAILGGYLFAALQTLVVAATPALSEYKNVIGFAIMVIIITWRPTGLLAERTSERV
ncbi:branched-chain amino acid ABC transporter permease (plasmid) [Bosea vestrisii]|uniref:branched-chain amino acid ABC transporter permease n=1 Tax=Bosea vestrisii TaxID=151416 RepID=UPI0024E0257E|nr:branched-chain amino acid ABC transporter permease [Bosea vestrisii]WID99872.1 branched-chain amino acid ABC transporter permease [Bosea vestrisii]